MPSGFCIIYAHTIGAFMRYNTVMFLPRLLKDTLSKDTHEVGMKIKHIALIGVSITVGIVTTYTLITSVIERDRSVIFERVRTLGNFIEITDKSDSILDKQVRDIREINRDMRFLYVGSIDYQGEISLLAEDYAVGATFTIGTDLDALLRDAFYAGETKLFTYREGFQYWFSVASPIKDKQTNEIVGFVAFDVSAIPYFLTIFMYGSLPLLLTLLAVTIIFLSHHIPQKERKYIDQKAEFLSVASHEIRTPLTGIKWASESLIDKQKIKKYDTYTRHMIELIHDNCVTLIDRLNELLAITVFEKRGAIEMKLESFPLYELIDKVVSGLALTATSRGVQVIVDSSLSKKVKVFGDREQLRQVFVNLISNAIKYTATDSEVVISYSRQNQNDMISVTDHGPGISHEEIPLIFEGYYRSKSAKKSGQYGNGLGLFIAREIIRAHKGTITVSSVSGKGSTFIVFLPVTV